MSVVNQLRSLGAEGTDELDDELDDVFPNFQQALLRRSHRPRPRR